MARTFNGRFKIARIHYRALRTMIAAAMTAFHATLTINHFGLVVFYGEHTMFAHIVTSHTTNAFALVDHRIP
jgi:hypothetical protein